MPDYKVIVKNYSPVPQGITAFHIDSPATESSINGFLLQLRGWIVGEFLPGKKIRLWDKSLGSSICVSDLNESRPDVLAAHNLPENTGSCGFNFSLNLLNLPAQATVILQFESTEGNFIAFAELDIQRPLLQPTWQCKRHPILVNSLGRSGSSLLMRLLAQHPDIVIQSPHPFEGRLAKFYVNQLLQRYAEYLAGETNDPPDNLQAVNMHWLHHELSQHESLIEQYSQLDFNALGDFVLQAIDRAYDLVDESEATHKPLSRYYAEKSGSGHTARLMMELYPEGQEIFLVRDFRDMYCSMLQFSQQRQTDDFGWQSEHADDYMDIVAERVEQLRVSFESRKKIPLVLRYEDLLTKPRDVLQQLLNDMDLTHHENTINNMVNAMNNPVNGHITSKSAYESIQRWKKELNRKQQSRINMIMQQSLSTFGYLT
jgi:hypothetical protein